VLIFKVQAVNSYINYDFLFTIIKFSKFSYEYINFIKINDMLGLAIPSGSGRRKDCGQNSSLIIRVKSACSRIKGSILVDLD
jgi:hypothetical protein